MNLGAVMDEMAVALRTIPNWTVHAFPPGKVSAPAAVVVYPESITFDETGRRGGDRMRIPVLAVVGRPTARGAKEELAAYASGSGARSVKAALQAHTYTACHEVHVAGVEFDVVTIGGTDYLAAMFDCDVVGQGE